MSACIDLPSLGFRKWCPRLVCLAGALLAACALVPPGPNVGAPGPAVTPPEITAEVARLEARIRAGNAPPSAHRDLAMLLVDARNPVRNYPSALRELERYAAADPGGAEDGQGTRNWLFALRALEETELERAILDVRYKATSAEASAGAQALERTRRELHEAKRAREALAKENADKDELLATLRKENKEMKETIEKLKDLDLRMDQLRKRTH